MIRFKRAGTLIHAHVQLDPERVTWSEEVEITYKDPKYPNELAVRFHMADGTTFDVTDPDRDVQQRLADFLRFGSFDSPD